MRRLTPIFLIALIALGLWYVYSEFWPEISVWARAQQRELQNGLARAVAAVRTGDTGALWALLGACAAYGVVHAIGPGHGKILIGGAAVATRGTAARMALIALTASLMQAVTAVVLVYGSLGLLTVSSGWILGTTERLLAPLSFAAMALIGIWIACRGARLFHRLASGPALATNTGANDIHVANTSHGHHHNHAEHDHAHGDTCEAGCKHMPSAREVESAGSWREIAALVASIGVRPCSGALIVLVIPCKFGLHLVGIASAFAMAIGTGAVVATVALLASWIRRLRGPDDAEGKASLSLFAGIQVCAGLFVAVVCFALMATSLETPSSSGLLR